MTFLLKNRVKAETKDRNSMYDHEVRQPQTAPDILHQEDAEDAEKNKSEEETETTGITG